MVHPRSVFAGSILALSWLALPLFADNGATNQAYYITFQVPGVVNQMMPTAINSFLTVAGNGNNGLEPIAFVRDVFGRSAFVGVDHCFRLWASDINELGSVVGSCEAPPFHAYIRDFHGTTTMVDCPGAGGTSTSAYSINTAGAIVGSCGGSGTPAFHSFVRSPQGILTQFDPPGSNGGSFAATINDGGAIAGVFNDTSNIQHGFVRHPNGTFTVFDLPGVFIAFGQFGQTIAFDMNAAGEIAGTYQDSKGTFHAFVRSTQGVVTSFDVQASTNTYAYRINGSGTITGYYTDSTGASHGYVRTRKGTITSFDVPNSISTAAFAINSFGGVTGYFTSATGEQIAFIRIPFFGERED